MDQDWIKSPTARRILVHWADSRPAWLWSADGSTLVWRNQAARLFSSKIKKHGLKFGPEATPIKGQVPRLIRMGSLGRSALARVQLAVGDKPVSLTCTSTPLQLWDGSASLLLVAVDAIDSSLVDALPPAGIDPVQLSLITRAPEWLLIDRDGGALDGSPWARAELPSRLAATELLALGAEGHNRLRWPDHQIDVARYRASPQDATLLLLTLTPAGAEPAIEAMPAEAVEEPVSLPEPPLAPAEPEALPALDTPLAPAAPEPAIEPPSLSGLFDRLAEDSELFAPLPPLDTTTEAPFPLLSPEPVAPAPIYAAEAPAAPPSVSEAPAQSEPESAEPDSAETDAISELIADAAMEHPEDELPVAPSDPVLWKITARRFTALPPRPADAEIDPPLPEEDDIEDEIADEAGSDSPQPLPDRDTIERVSRYNFDELSRILTDRVAAEPPAPPVAPPPPPPVTPPPDHALISLSGENLVLNRLPVGLMIFRDQQILFANRALADLLGFDTIESLRVAGLASVFPAELVAGPVTHLVRRDGKLQAVSARLQSIQWNGQTALMLSASQAESRLSHEQAVHAFAELAADLADLGFVATDRFGLLTTLSLHGRVIIGKPETDLIGRPLATLLTPEAGDELRAFLDRPARFAETARPAIVLAVTEAEADLVLFTEGQAGIVTGYFGFLRRRDTARSEPDAHSADDDVEPTILARISRGIRRPLNTIVGFADMIRTGAGDSGRIPEYAGDIKLAGEEIATLVSELDDYARLREGRYPLQTGEIDLGQLLETCLFRVRRQAGDARVLVRSAVSARLPRITADRASLMQAILNLLASAIDQSPAGGSVILSAQREENGDIVIHVRDSGDPRRDLGERFVVFRDGVGRGGEALAPVRSSVGLALTRSLLAVNALTLTIDPTASNGTLFSLTVPADLAQA